jgi:hypothetical protein
MSGGLFVNALLREIRQPVSPDRVQRIQQLHTEAFLNQASQVPASTPEDPVLSHRRRKSLGHEVIQHITRDARDAGVDKD